MLKNTTFDLFLEQSCYQTVIKNLYLKHARNLNMYAVFVLIIVT